MFPWPAKRDRKAAIAAAAAEHARSRAQAAQSRAVRQEIGRLARANHYADIITGDIIKGHEGGRGRA
jgi:hypothetical protein